MDAFTVYLLDVDDLMGEYFGLFYSELHALLITTDRNHASLEHLGFQLGLLAGLAQH